MKILLTKLEPRLFFRSTCANFCLVRLALPAIYAVSFIILWYMAAVGNPMVFITVNTGYFRYTCFYNF